MHCYRFKVKP